MNGATSAGRMRHRFEVREKVETPDGAGGFFEEWQRRFDVWAEIEPMGAASAYQARAQSSEISHRLRIRKRADVRAGMRMLRQRRVFDLLTVFDPDETGRFLVLEAREISS